ncbi:MAG: formylglycine-generating enzyme family protein [Planctomycetota bacterium]
MNGRQNARLVMGLTLASAVATGVLGWQRESSLLLIGAFLGGGYAIWGLTPGQLARLQKSPSEGKRTPAPPPPPPRPKKPTADGVVGQMLAEGRAALVLRPLIAEGLEEAVFQEAIEALHAQMAFVPEGDVELETPDEQQRSRVTRVGAFFLDRYPLTNEQYYSFVAGGGYEQMALWDESIWPAILDFVDRTGKPGPQYWRDGRYLPGEERHPVVGVSWYEASACARWLGKRLPTDAEWVKAGAWPVALSEKARVQRRYPWGETMDRKRANVWGAGPERIVSVDEFADGVSVGGVYQLIGNVWEWTWGSFARPGADWSLPCPMKTIRGGAFDTYFDNQATCQFRSGENPLARRHNIGFRCAIAMSDLLLSREPKSKEEAPATEEPSTEEVPT